MEGSKPPLRVAQGGKVRLISQSDLGSNSSSPCPDGWGLSVGCCPSEPKLPDLRRGLCTLKISAEEGDVG